MLPPFMRIAMVLPDDRDEFKQWDRPEPYFGTAPTALLEGFGGRPEVEVHVVCCVHRPMRSPRHLAADNIFYHPVLVPRIGWRALYAGCVLAIRRKLHEIRPDVVHGQGTERHCAMSAAFSGYPNVITIHGNMRLVAQVYRARPFSFNWLAARLERFTLPRVGGVICITRYTENAVRALARRTWLLPNAVRASFFEVPREPDPVPLLLCIGKICLRKNQNALIRALDPLAARHRFNLCFLGLAQRGTPYEDEFFDLVGARPWCRHEGFASCQTLQAALRRATAVVLPSLEDNCPMVVLEGMAAGVPVVAPDVGGVPDLVEDGRNGILCNPHDAASLRAGVERVLRDSAAVTAMTALARHEARQRFHPQVIASRHLEIYHEVLGAAR
jgi:glycosyltransferase involved in cell wall biosynthesis